MRGMASCVCGSAAGYVAGLSVCKSYALHALSVGDAFFGCRGHEPEPCMLDMLRTQETGVTADGDKNREARSNQDQGDKKNYMRRAPPKEEALCVVVATVAPSAQRAQ